jgi:hypothetical protein
VGRAATLADVASPPPVTGAKVDEEGSTPPVDSDAILVVIGISPDACSPPTPELKPVGRGMSPEACSPPRPALKPDVGAAVLGAGVEELGRASVGESPVAIAYPPVEAVGELTAAMSLSPHSAAWRSERQ